MLEGLAKKLSNQGFQRYFFHMSWNFFGRIVNILVAFFVNIYVVRYLGPDRYGFLSYAVSFTGIFSFLAALGVDSVLYVKIVRHPEKRDELMGGAFLLKLIGSGLAFLAIALILPFAQNNHELNTAIILIAATYFFQSFSIINTFFQASVKAKPTVIISVFTSVFLSVLKLLLVLAHARLSSFIGVLLLENVISMVGNIIIYKRLGLSIMNWKLDSSMAKQIFSSSWPLMLSSASALVYSRIDQVLIKYLMNQSSVGFYDVGVRLAENWYMLPTIIVGSVYPAVINASKVSLEHRDNRLVKLYAFLFYVSIALILPVSIFSDTIIKLLYGEAFIAASLVLKIYIWSGIGISIGAIINQYLIAENSTKASFFLNAVNMAVNVLLNLLFIPRFGLAGAAYATLISYTVFPLSVIFVKGARHQLKLLTKGILLKGIYYGE